MSGLTRRGFLKRSAAVAAGAAFPTVLPSSVFGQNAPSNRINVAVIGIGAQGRGHVNGTSSHSDLQVVGICDVHGGRVKHYVDQVNAKYGAKTASGKYDGVRGFRDFRELLALPGLDAVVIATPNHWHSIIAVAACKAGKDVYCEKPLADTIAESRAMADAAKQYGTVFMTGSQQRSDTTFRFAAELVRNGKIGKIKEVYVAIGPPAQTFCDLPEEKCPESLDWDFWCGPSQWRPYSSVLCPDGWDFGFPNWRGFAQYGGGGQSDFGAHHFDIAQWGLGTDDTGPVDVVYNGPKEKKRFTYTYASGIKMHVGSKVPGDATTWVGEEGTVAVNRGAFLVTDPVSLADYRFKPTDLRLYESRNHLQNWVECMKSRRATICTAEIGHRTASVCSLGHIAYRVGRPLKWDPQAERFLGDDEANRLVRREMRAPWTL